MSTMKNRVQLIGNLGQDPDVVKFEKGTTKATFSLATNESYKNQGGEKVEQVDWHQVVAWGHTAQFIEKYLAKGLKVGVEGKLSNRSFETKNGDRKYITEVIANEVVMLSPKKES